MQNFYIRVSGWKGSRDVRHRYGHCWAEPAASDERGPVECKTFTSVCPAGRAPATSATGTAIAGPNRQQVARAGQSNAKLLHPRVRLKPLPRCPAASGARGPVECKTFTSVCPAGRAPAMSANRYGHCWAEPAAVTRAGQSNAKLLHPCVRLKGLLRASYVSVVDWRR